MSELAKLIGKGKTFNIGGIGLLIKPRTMEDIELVVDLSVDEKRGAAMKELIKKTLKDSIPDATDEEVSQVGIQHFKAISEAIMDVNELTKDE